MDETKIQTIQEVRQFLKGSDRIEFKPALREEKYTWVASVLRRFKYLALRRADKGLVCLYLEKVSGYSRAQVFRLISRYREDGVVQCQCCRRRRFPQKYTRADMELLSKTDELHGCLSGPATKKILERECREYGHKEFRNISMISVAHLYNLRRKSIRLGIARHFTRTRPCALPIGERARPDPRGEPGHIRIDTVHQGDLDGNKGVYHINAVDQVTQWEVIASVERISEAYLLPSLELMLTEFPFVIHGFHSDNGGEFVNYQVAKLLNKLYARFTKSRPRHCNDNALAESKNGSVLRKNLGYDHIPQRYAEELNVYHKEYLNPYINFHRPCFFPVVVMDHKGKAKKQYPYQEVKTPYERFKALPRAEDHLRRGTTLAKLESFAHQMSDNESAERMVEARSDLFQRIANRKSRLPKATILACPLVHTTHKEKVAKRKLVTTPSVSFFD
jgi:hypothetical protein